MKSLLKFVTCGGVNDGKSTLIGHLLYDSKYWLVDQEAALELDSKAGGRGGEIDVAYHYFMTDRRSFIVAEAPGHEEYARSTAVGACFADLAVIVIDATKGVVTQTRRNARICSLLGIKHFVVAVNKMDLIAFDQNRFHEMKDDFMKTASGFHIESIRVIPVSATEGDNITRKSLQTHWYHGLPLLPYLESVEVDNHSEQRSFITPVQRVSRPNAAFCGFQGQVEAGTAAVGDEVITLPSHEGATVKNLLRVTNAEYVQAADMFTATMLWMDDTKLVPGRNYVVKVGTKLVSGTVMSIKHKIDINTGNRIPVDQIFKNEFVKCDISLSEKIALDSFENNEALGVFIVIDSDTQMTSACGVIEHALRRSTNIVWQKTDITREIRARQKGQKPLTLWFTGLSGSGKSTLANEVEKRLVAIGHHTMLLDGDNIRHGLNKNLGFTESDRVENIRRAAEAAKLLNDAGIITLASFISPYKSDRKNAREIVGGDFIEIYVSTPIEECERRDVKGLYKKARAGEIPNFTGISSPYEEPDSPDIAIDTSLYSLQKATDYIMNQVLLRL